MDPQDVKRRLTCLLAMDAVGYSRLVGADEANTLRVLTAHRAVIDGIIAFHNGRIVNTAGDSVLAEFGSVVDGVRCAVEIQDALRTRNESLPEAQRMQFRIGLNLGEVVVKGTDLLGDGVNVAARLQSIAEPGGILVSSSVYDQITGKLDLGFDDIGEQELKNISRPIRAFRVSGTAGTKRVAEAPAHVAEAPRRRPAVGAIAVIGAIAAALALAWWQGWIGAKRDTTPVVATVDADKARIEAELAAERKARLEAEAAAVRAKAESDAAALKAQAERDAATTRAKAEGEAAAARAKAREASQAKDAAKAKAGAPQPVPAVAQAAPTPPPAAAPAKPDPTRFDGEWLATEQCGPLEDLPAFKRELRVTIRNGEAVHERGRPGEPGYARFSGKSDERGWLVIDGHGISSVPKYRGKPYRAHFEGPYNNGSFDLSGHQGDRRCRLTIERAR